MNYHQLKYLETEDLRTIIRDAQTVLSQRHQKQKSKNKDLENSRENLNKHRDLYERNSSGVLAIPEQCRKPGPSSEYFLPALINQDWSDFYPENEKDTTPIYYVYAHVDPTKKCFHTEAITEKSFKGRPFYIGKGSGNRAYDLNRNQGHGRILKRLTDSGYMPSDIVQIVFNKLPENKALELEAKLIYYFGTVYEDVATHNIKKWLVNLEVPKLPDFKGEMLSKNKWLRCAPVSAGSAVLNGDF